MNAMAFRVDLNHLPEELREVAAGLKSLPSAKNDNPLSIWIQSYQLREKGEGRPTVNQFGSFRGNTWHPLEPAYIRTTDGMSVPVWGGVPRLRGGRVTRASVMGTRRASGLTRAEKKAGYGAVVIGQTFRTGPVKGKLKADGSRYKSSDRQLGRDSGGHLFGEWVNPRNIVLSASGLVATLAHPFSWAPRIAERRNFMWSSRIESDEIPQFVKHVGAYIDKMLRRITP